MKSLPKSEIKEILIAKGIKNYISTNLLADKLGICRQTIYRARKNNQLHAIANNCYHLENIVEWIYKNPKYIIPPNNNWQLSNEVYSEITKVIQNWQCLLKFWQLEDLIAEVQIRIARRKKNSIPLQLVINRILGELWRNNHKKPLFNSIPLNERRM